MTTDEAIAIAKTLRPGLHASVRIFDEESYNFKYGILFEGEDGIDDNARGTTLEEALLDAGWKPKQDMSSIDELSTPVYFEED